ncbi:MAG: CidA/LrgA family protein [Betaproteobacteria bacterium]|nr:CidA/LrgA family protein [Betaproteobacteria bacterium]
MLAGITTLLLFQCAGEVLVRALKLPFPGPVLGMLLLLVALLVRGRTLPPALHEAGHGILRHLSLLFLPAGVGVMLYYRSLTDAPASMFVVLVVSTIATIAATALTIQWLSRRAGDPARPRSEPADAP